MRNKYRMNTYELFSIEIHVGQYLWRFRGVEWMLLYTCDNS